MRRVLVVILDKTSKPMNMKQSFFVFKQRKIEEMQVLRNFKIFFPFSRLCAGPAKHAIQSGRH